MRIPPVRPARTFGATFLPGVFLVALTGLFSMAGAQGQADPADGVDFFERKVRPVLAERCYECHSARAGKKVKGGLLLDSKDGVLKGGHSGPVIVPGDPDRSRLIQAVRYADPELRMPPKGKLTDQQLEDLVAWVRRGAPDPRTRPSGADSGKAPTPLRQHWAFQPIQAVPLPEVKLRPWIKSPVDLFILEKLEEKGLQPSPEADKRTLIRRATFDLIGLPPMPEEIDAFLADDSQDAFAKVVDRLLASPHYGERWGRHWLDVARYADTKGYVQIPEERRYVQSHAYRDWVIRAFNEDLPYDKFLIQQIAGDLLVPSGVEGLVPSEDRRSLAALGFLTVGRRFKNIIHDIIDDRIDVLARGTMALTVSCARCHDHKFDPIPTQDYYSLYGVFAGTIERTIPLSREPERTEAYVAYEKELKRRKDAFESALQSIRRRIEERHRARAGDYLQAVLEADRLPAEEAFLVLSPEEINPVVVRRWQAYLARTGGGFHPVFALWHTFAGIPEKDLAARVAAVIDEMNDGRLNPRVVQSFDGEPPASMREVAERYGKALAEVRTPAASKDPALEELREVLYGAESPVNLPAGGLCEIEYFLDEKSMEELKKLQARIDRWILESDGAPSHAVTLEDRPAPHNPRVFRRGNPDRKGEEVPRQFLACVSDTARRPFERGSGRLELAHAVASRENPLTARVMVNRLWLHHFGEGLVRTPSDFGLRSEPPTHPGLLDYLARRFMDDGPSTSLPSTRAPSVPSLGTSGAGWSIKRMHRLIMHSGTYRQSSEDNPRSRRVDPANTLLWRMNRRRLDFESMRDACLAVAGQLDPAMGGRPEDLTSQPFSRRRTVYGLIDRLNLPNMYRIFDFSSPDAHSPQRHLTTVAPQALFLMNSPFALEQARRLANRPEVASEPEGERRIQRLYGCVYGRAATASEVALGLDFLRSLASQAPLILKSEVWRYGFAEFDAAVKQMKAFQPLPRFTGNVWHAGPPNLLISPSPQVTDVKTGWPTLSAEGGHPGADRRYAVIRRWTAPSAGCADIGGRLGGDIAARIVSSRTGELASGKTRELKVKGVEVEEGDAIDFIVGGRDYSTEEAFMWSPKIRMTDPSGAVLEWDAARDFGGPPVAPLTPWEQYAQVLLASNEFVIVD